MRLIADENIPGAVVHRLRRSGHDVIWIAEQTPGSPDPPILAQAAESNRLMLTFDKDFGELVFRSRRFFPPGVILLRLNPDNPEALADRVVAVLAGRDDWPGHFTVITDQRIRMVPMPQ